MEYVGAIEVEPTFRGASPSWVRGFGWEASRDGRTIRPRPDTDLDGAIGALREMISLDTGRRSYAGVVAAYDDESRDLVIITARDGSVARRTVRRPRVQVPSNVIDLASRRRTISRQIS